VTHEEFARAYADWMAELSRRNQSGLWWALTLPSKNPVSSRLPRRVWLRLSGLPDEKRAATWKDSLNAWLPTGPLWGFARAVVRAARARRFPFPDASRRWTFIATLLNHQSFRPDGSYRDTYFGELPDKLRDVLVIGPVTHDYKRTMDRLRFPVLPWDRFAGLGDLLSCLGETLWVRLFGIDADVPTFKGLDVSDLVREELADNARSSRLFSDRWFYWCAKAALRRLKPAKLLLPFENRAWERQLALAFREKNAAIVGYQHASITANHLNYVLGRGEEDLLPLPDQIVTMGEVTRERLVGRGRFPASKVVTGCALRQTPVPAPRQGACAARKVLLTLATSVEEYRAALALMEQVSGAEIVARPHPEFPLPKTSLRVEPSWTIEQAFDWADVVAYASSTLGLEAVRRGLPTIFLQLSDFLSMDPMESFDALKWTAKSPKDVESVLAQISSLDLKDRRAEARAYSDRYFKAADAASLEPLTA
jgi:hypothetical protein